MPRPLPRLAALCCLAMLLAAPLARAQVAPEAIRQGNEAAARFIRLATGDAGPEALPRLSDPAAAPLLRALWNSEAVVAGRPQPKAGTTELDEWRRAGAEALRFYLAALHPATRANAARAGRPVPGYQAEVARGLLFLLRASTSAQQGARDHIARLPPAQRRDRQARLDQGLGRMGLGLAEITQSLLSALRMPGLPPEDRRALAAALAQDLPLFRALLTPAQCQALDQDVATVLPALADPDSRAALASVQAALRRAE